MSTPAVGSDEPVASIFSNAEQNPDDLIIDEASLELGLFPIDLSNYSPAVQAIAGPMLELLEKKISLSFVEPFLEWHDRLVDLQSIVDTSVFVTLSTIIEDPDSADTMSKTQWDTLVRLIYGLSAQIEAGIIRDESSIVIIQEVERILTSIAGLEANPPILDLLDGFPTNDDGNFEPLKNASVDDFMALKVFFHSLDVGRPDSFPGFAGYEDTLLKFEGDSARLDTSRISDDAPMIHHMLQIANAVGNNMDTKYALHLVTGKAVYDVRLKVNDLNRAFTAVIKRGDSIRWSDLNSIRLAIQDLKDEINNKSSDDWGNAFEAEPSSSSAATGIWKDVLKIEDKYNELNYAQHENTLRNISSVIPSSTLRAEIKEGVDIIGDLGVDLDGQIGALLRSNADKLRVIQTEISTLTSFVSNFMNKYASAMRAVIGAASG